jgi:hypothetical protein
VRLQERGDVVCRYELQRLSNHQTAHPAPPSPILSRLARWFRRRWLTSPANRSKWLDRATDHRITKGRGSLPYRPHGQRGEGSSRSKMLASGLVGLSPPSDGGEGGRDVAPEPLNTRTTIPAIF